MYDENDTDDKDMAIAIELIGDTKGDRCTKLAQRNGEKKKLRGMFSKRRLRQREQKEPFIRVVKTKGEA